MLLEQVPFLLVVRRWPSETSRSRSACSRNASAQCANERPCRRSPLRMRSRSSRYQSVATLVAAGSVCSPVVLDDQFSLHVGAGEDLRGAVAAFQPEFPHRRAWPAFPSFVVGVRPSAIYSARVSERPHICCQVLSSSGYRKSPQAEVAERQTHQLEGLAIARSWGFESPLPHQ